MNKVNNISTSQMTNRIRRGDKNAFDLARQSRKIISFEIL